MLESLALQKNRSRSAKNVIFFLLCILVGRPMVRFEPPPLPRRTHLQRYIYTASEQRKARTKTTLLKFLLSRNIRSLRNTTHNNERYVPITGYCRQNYTRTKCINSLDHHRSSPQNNEYYGRQSIQRLSSVHISRQKEMWI